MKSLGIGHDWAHCNGNDCSVKERCVRYLLHLEAVEQGERYVTYVIPKIVKTREGGEECGFYWKNKK